MVGTVRHAQVGLGGPGGVARTNVVVSMTNQVHVQLGVVAVHIKDVEDHGTRYYRKQGG